MNGCLAIMKMRLKALLQYKAAAFAGVCTQLFWGLINVIILKAFYAERQGYEPINFSQAAAYIWIGQALLSLLPWSIDKELQSQIKDGNIAYELVRPLYLYYHWFARCLALKIGPTLLRSFPIFILVGFTGQLPLPSTWESTLAFSTSLLGAIFLSTAITVFVICTLFWTYSGEGILRLMPVLAMLFSGIIVPLPLFPDWMQGFINIQPFRGVMDIPCRFYIGMLPAEHIIYYLSFQIAWALVFIGFSQWLMKRAMSQFVIQGG
jgi:ABC-2 type transport system permease protein